MIGAAAWTACFAMLYGPVLVKLAMDWSTDANYAHGFLIPPAAAFLVWRQRHRLAAETVRPAAAGFAVVAVGLAVFALGALGAELFLTRVSMLAVLAGTVVVAFGWSVFRVVGFALGFLIFMIPLPAIVFDRVAVSLQLVGSACGEYLLQTAGVPVLRDGNLLTLAQTTLQVNDACSGIRSIVALLAMTTLAIHLQGGLSWRRAWLVAAVVPIAVAFNGVRIALTGLAVSRYGAWAAEGLTHELTGLATFVFALAALYLLDHASRARRTLDPSCVAV